MNTAADSLTDAELQEFITQVAKLESRSGTADLDPDAFDRLMTESARLGHEVRKVVPGSPWYLTVWALNTVAASASTMMFF